MVAVIVPIVLHSTAMVAVIREREESFAPTTVTTVRVDTVSAREVIRGITEAAARVAISSAPTTAKAAISVARAVTSSAPITVKAATSSARVVISHAPTIARVVTRTVPAATRSALRATILMPSTA